jgi:HEAT repeat protein
VSHPTDLLPYGELLADAGLVARLLDDGGLSLAEDDSLPDEARVVFTGRPEGLAASLKLFPCEDATPELLAAIEDLNPGPPEFFWEGGFVGCGEVLPWTPNHEFALADLKAFFTRVARGADKAQPLRKIAEAAAPAGASAGGPAMLPPSFLPGSGQSDRAEGATQRYGAIDATPGRAEVDEEDVRWSTGKYRQPEAGSGGGGGAGLVIIGVGLLLFLGVGAGGLFFYTRSQSGFGGGGTAVATPTPGTERPTGTETGGSSDPDPDSTERPWRTALATPTPKKSKNKRDPYVLAASVSADERLLGVKRWRKQKLDILDGARLKMLNALDGREDRQVSQILLQSMRDSPPEVLESIDLLDRLPPGNAMWRFLVEQFGKAEMASEELEVVADVLTNSPDTKDLLVEETLVRIGKAKKGAGSRLLESRGVEWLQVGDGKTLFGKLPLEQQADLLKHSDSRARLAGIELIAEAGRDGSSAEVVKILSKHLASDDTELKRRAIEEIGSLGEGIAAWYLALAMMREKDRRSLELLRNAIARLPSKDAITWLRKLAAHKQTDRRKAAVSALRVIKHPEAIEAIMKAVKDKDRQVRLAALAALANFAKDSEYRVTVGKGVLDYRRIAKDRSDPEARRYARQLCLSIDGRLPK